MDYMPYEVKKKGKATLRLYLNDPKILKAIVKKGVLRIPVPLEIEGEWALGKTKDGKLHYLFTHDDFIPIFIDLKGKKDPKQ